MGPSYLRSGTVEVVALVGWSADASSCTVRWNTIFENICTIITLRYIKGYLLDLWSNNSEDDGTDRPGIAWSESRRQSGSGLWNHSGSNIADRVMTTARRQRDRCENRSRDCSRR